MENSQRSKLVHFYQKKTSGQSHVGGGGGDVVMRHWIATASCGNSGVFQLCGRSLMFDQYKWTIAHESVGHFGMHVLLDIAGTLPWRDWTKSVWEAHTRYWFGQGDSVVIDWKKNDRSGLGERLRIGAMVVIRWLYDMISGMFFMKGWFQSQQISNQLALPVWFLCETPGWYIE